MKDQNKQGIVTTVKRNSEEEQCRVFLEASLNIGVPNFSLSDIIIGKGNKLTEGLKNHVFLSNINQQFKFYLGQFSLDKLIPYKISYPHDEKIINENINNLKNNVQIKSNKNNKTTIYNYTLYYGQASISKSMDLSEIKDELTSQTPEINPKKNKNTSFKYSIQSNGTNYNNNKLGILKQVNFYIQTPNKCFDCGEENSIQNPLIFCQNDKSFFCSNCDKIWHEKKDKKSLSLHFRSNKYKYTLSYFGTCSLVGHLNKPYKYFDEKNKTCMCVKCVESLNSSERVDNDIKYIDEYLKEKENKEDFMNSRIDAICDEIDAKLNYAEEIWDKIDKYEKNYCDELEKRRKDTIKEMNDEGFARQTFLSCIFMEIQRILKEIDSKIIFNKNERNNVDVSTFLYMNQIYQDYMKNELTSNLDFLSSTNLENFGKPIATINNSNGEMYDPIDLEQFNYEDYEVENYHEDEDY